MSSRCMSNADQTAKELRRDVHHSQQHFLHVRRCPACGIRRLQTPPAERLSYFAARQRFQHELRGSGHIAFHAAAGVGALYFAWYYPFKWAT